MPEKGRGGKLNTMKIIVNSKYSIFITSLISSLMDTTIDNPLEH